ncbi:MAG: aminotransferase class I/II-fold pyridoxal phosphate-dependent enzyme [Verrucomicrobiota bacterium]|nr:aminotransferase class I/II-fold pyridoxal phosphate-dependent enzyme [Verrucomicrobiota bacterium]
MNNISRRRFAHLLGAGAAFAAARPALSLAKPPLTALPAGSVVRLSSNENPFGPSPKARKAMTDAFEFACRYPDDHAEELVAMLAKQDEVSPEQVLLGAGSSEILEICAIAFTGRGAERSGAGDTLVVADPTFELIARHASFHGAEVVKIPLTSSYAHDLPQMAAAAKGGLIYVCNPNNPTASLTPKNDVRELINTAPRETMILVDEAYHHYVESPDYESVIPLVKDHPNLIVARTFSKIYGMAGLRCGYCVAQPEVLERLRPLQSSDSVNIMALAAGLGSLRDPEQVAKNRQLNAQTRAMVMRELKAMGYPSIASEANFVMTDVKRPVPPLIAAMKDRKVQIGRLFPSLPNHMRLTIGKEAEMKAFLSAFRQVAAA